jgi:predicted amidohydrolase YtcJ
MVLVAKAAFAADVADLILVDASVVTMDRAVPRAQAIAVKDGLILAVGSIEQVLALKGDATRVRDLDGSVVMPGFVDPQGSCAAAGLAAAAADLSGADAGDEQASRQMIERHAKEPVSRRLGVVLGAMNSRLASASLPSSSSNSARTRPATNKNGKLKNKPTKPTACSQSSRLTMSKKPGSLTCRAVSLGFR